ncbi:putative duf221-domain-containing protein [Rosellinia necatrix]|uniref:Putative duf221-domain-containing protein n=1 Tax=Rosellinia necatrix TaxID=77044 RepID=A0A1W2TGS4_ROSNE|nr:putative duf221-domain-containing protein [Rosellinia necatrix]
MTDDNWDKCKADGEAAVAPGSKNISVQLVLSLALGLSAFIAFCILRPRWKTLYAARKRRDNREIALPVLPDSFLGWIPALYKITEDQVLASAGLDAFVFLSFFKMSIRLFSTMFFFSIIILWPIHKTFDTNPNPGGSTPPPPKNDSIYLSPRFDNRFSDASSLFAMKDKGGPADKSWSYLWSYLIFTWFFSLLTIYFMNAETFKVVKIRQDYLGTQSTVTDRTFRLAGIPKDLRSEEKIKEFVENLEIGHVRNVNLCRNWAEIDGLVAQRRDVLHKLEEAWSAYRSRGAMVPRAAIHGNHVMNENEQDDDHEEHEEENDLLLPGNGISGSMGERERPKIRLRFGFLKMRNRRIDALDYYEDQLRRLDEKILRARKTEYTPTGTAFVTMDSIAACQMALQATVDPRPGQLLIKPAPSPHDVVWKNTYAPRYRRRLQSSVVTIFITTLTIIWLFPVALLAQLLSICNIGLIAPSLATLLQRHEITKALVQTGLPTLVVSLLNVLVPYLYDYLSNIQGTISQGDVELSVISKNFFFVFFNIFVVYAVSGSAALADFWQIIRESLSDTNAIAARIAQSIQNLSNFYLNFIMLQGFGLFPFKLLQFGSVTMYPFYRMGAKTPRDFAELVQPNLFNYGFYLPTALLIFILCLVYSVLPGSELVLLLGVCYFGLGYFVYKYQLLYSMDQPQHATGRAWPIICRRIILGLISFQVVMLAILVLRKAFSEAALVTPLVVFTLWYNWYFHQQFVSLTKFIALRSIKRHSDPGRQSNPNRNEVEQVRLTRRMSTIDEDRERGMAFINPSLIAPLEQPWIYQDPPALISPAGSAGTYTPSRYEDHNSTTPGHHGTPTSTASSFSLGDTHVWRDSGDNNV